MLAGDVSHRLAEVALAIADAAGLEDTCRALGRGVLNRDSTAAARAEIAGGNAVLGTSLRILQDAWQLAGPCLSAEALTLLLKASVESAAATRRNSPATQVVWTGPKVEGSYLRATREVIRELLHNANSELQVVGYWIAARVDSEGIIEEVIASLAEAVQRRVSVTVVVDERVRPDGRDNRDILLSLWPAPVPPPRMLTWRLPAGDQHLKLHAKVLVADRRDALVTSANLTAYAMDRNIEMGVRILGRPAADIARHFDLLAQSGVLEPYLGEGKLP